jgi:hypothetical protein
MMAERLRYVSLEWSGLHVVGLTLNGLIWTGLATSKWSVHGLLWSGQDGLACIWLGWFDCLCYR